jgi:serpin B
MKICRVLNLLLSGMFFMGQLSLSGEERSLQPSREDSPILTEMDTLVLSNNELGFDIYSRINKGDQNLVFSPYSIATVLEMLYAGSAGLTQSQMSRVLHITQTPSVLEEAVSHLTNGLANKNRHTGDDFTLNAANALWVQHDHPILPAFEKSMTTAYKGIIKAVDFKDKADFSRLQVNDWVKAQTQGKIVDLLSSQDVTRSTRLILVSALYMHAKWQSIFDSSLTQPMPFFPFPSRTLTVPMMSSTTNYGFQREKNFSIVELPYAIKEDSPKVAMYIVLPHETYGLQEVEKSINAQSLLNLMRGLKKVNLTLTIPKFKITSTIGLKDLLEGMGLTDPFSSDANFSGIDGTKDLQVSNVLQKAFIAVDEKGTEAGVASAVTIGVKSILAEPSEILTVDHPFLFFIVDKVSGTYLFMGRVVMPQ